MSSLGNKLSLILKTTKQWSYILNSTIICSASKRIVLERRLITIKTCWSINGIFWYMWLTRMPWQNRFSISRGLEVKSQQETVVHDSLGLQELAITFYLSAKYGIYSVKYFGWNYNSNILNFHFYSKENAALQQLMNLEKRVLTLESA